MGHRSQVTKGPVCHVKKFGPLSFGIWGPSGQGVREGWEDDYSLERLV